MTIVFFRTGVSSPLAACWQALAAEPGVRLVVYLELPEKADTAYDHEQLLTGVEHRIRRAGNLLDRQAFAAEVAALEPDVCVVLGWRSRMCRAAAESPALAAVPKIFAFDMVYTPSLRKWLAPLVLRRYLRRYRRALVPGERSAAYARHLGFRDAAIEKGLIGIDMARYKRAHRERQALPAYPRRFLYVGRYVRDKAIDVLVAAYRRYRETVADPWPLSCCGMGPEAWRLEGVEGIENLGFVQPAELQKLLGRHGVFVLASRVPTEQFALRRRSRSIQLLNKIPHPRHVFPNRGSTDSRLCRSAHCPYHCRAISTTAHRGARLGHRQSLFGTHASERRFQRERPGRLERIECARGVGVEVVEGDRCRPVARGPGSRVRDRRRLQLLDEPRPAGAQLIR